MLQIIIFLVPSCFQFVVGSFFRFSFFLLLEECQKFYCNLPYRTVVMYRYWILYDANERRNIQNPKSR